MKKQLLISAVFCGLFAVTLGAQTGARYLKNTFYVSLLGEGATASLQYDRVVFAKNKLFIDVKAGIGAPNRGIDIFGNDPGGVGFPHSVSLNFGGRHAVEIGGGGIVTILDGLTEYAVYPTVGYKFRAEKKRVTFRVFAHPIDPGAKSTNILIPVGVSFGLSF